MIPAELAEICSRLYGPRWQAELSRVLGRSPGTVSKWANGVNPVPKVAERRIRELASESTC